MPRSRVMVVYLGFVLCLIAHLSSSALRAADTIQWKNIGPGGGGNMVNTAVSPADPNIVLMSSDVGGFFWSGNGGQTWKMANQIVVAPNWVGGIGSSAHAGFGFDWHAGRQHIVYFGPAKSTDAGRTWQMHLAPTTVAGAGGVVAENPLIVYSYGGPIDAVHGPRVFRTSDAWEGGPFQTSELPVGAGVIRSLVIKPGENDKIIACADTNDPYAPNSQQSGLFRSDDGAQNWTRIDPVSAGLPATIQCSNLTLHRATGQLFMAVRTTPVEGAMSFLDLLCPVQNELCTLDRFGGAYKSADWGATWSPINGTDGQEELLPNLGFDTPGPPEDPTIPAQDWTTATPNTVHLDTTEFPGNSVIRIDSAGNLDSNAVINVQAASLYKMTAYFSYSQAIGDIALIDVTWRNAGGQPVQFPDGSAVSPIYQSVNSPDPPLSTDHKWVRMETLLRRPDEAVTIEINIHPSPGGTTWMDNISLKPARMLPKYAGRAPGSYAIGYSDIVVDPTDVNTIYAGTRGGTFQDLFVDLRTADAGGVWKTVDGGATWTHVTRASWHDNVVNNFGAAPVCGDGVCGGGGATNGENCNTCPLDCQTSPCCGNESCDGGETYMSCQADCPFSGSKEISVANGHHAARAGSYTVWSLGIGSGPTGHQTLYWGTVKTTDGGNTWTEMNSTRYDAGSPKGTWMGNGDTNDVFTYPVAGDNRAPGRNWLFYGDDDNRLMVSYSGGASFSPEGWQWGSISVLGDAATSIVLDSDPNTIYVATSNGGTGRFIEDNTTHGGVAKGVYAAGASPEAMPTWTWSAVGNSFPHTTGHIDVVKSGGAFYAAVYGRGVYKAAGEGSTWTCLGGVACPNNSNWIDPNSTPVVPACGNDGICWKAYRIYQEPTHGRLYVTFGNPLYNGTAAVALETGIWESKDSENQWVRISNPNTGTDNGMDREPITDLVFVNSTTILASTWHGNGDTSDLAGSYIGDGGIYRGTCPDTSPADGVCDTGSTWTWVKEVWQPMVTGLAVSRATTDGSIVYAYVGQGGGNNPLPGQNAGIYKSVDGGDSWTVPLQNTGLMNLGHGRLYTSPDTHRLYASTIGDGVFEGTITCGPLAEGFADSDADGTPDCADANTDISSQITVTEGSVSGVVGNLRLSDNSYETLSEQTTGNPRKLTKVWTFNNVPIGKPYQLRVEGRKIAGGGNSVDDFKFSFLTKAAGSTCTNTDTYPPAQTDILTVVKTTDDNQFQSASLGTLTNPVVCVRAQDSKRTGSDMQTDRLELDQVVLYGVPPCTDADEDGYAASCSSCVNTFCPTVDCDDTDWQENQGRTEGPAGHPTCTDTKDNNCNGLIDAADTAVCPTTQYVLVERPNSDAGPNQGTPSPAGSHYLNVDDDPHDGDTSTLTLTTAGLREVFTTADQLLDTDIVTNVKVRWVAKKGSGSGWSGKAGLVIGASASEYYGPTRTLTTNYTLYEESFSLNPATNQAWAVWEVRAAKLIYQQVTNGMQLPRAKLTELVLVVTVLR